MPFSPSSSRPASGPATRQTPRQWTEKGFSPFRLEVLTPVFIGSGEQFGQLEWIIRSRGGEYSLCLVDLGSWLLEMSLNEPAETKGIEADPVKLQKILEQRPDLESYVFASLPMPRDLGKREQERKEGQMQIDSFARNPFTHTALVPGSSLKGAILTPLIDALDKGLSAGRSLRDAAGAGRRISPAYRQALEGMFGKIREHAMQALKVGDLAVPFGGTSIRLARERGKKPDKQPTPKNACESLNPGLTLWGDLRLAVQGDTPCVRLPDGTLWERKDIARLCNGFYLKRFADEWRDFYERPHFAQAREALERVRERLLARPLDPAREMLLRVGHYSHIECVTITRNRPETAKGFGNTRTLADGIAPFGWVLITFCSPEEYAREAAAIDAGIDDALKRQQKAAGERLAKLSQAAEEKAREAREKEREAKRREAERKEREAEEARLKAELAALSPDERLIREVALPDAIENRASDLYARLEKGGLEEKDRLPAASALKTFWERSGKWSGKALTKKQKEKVAKVREILGEG